MYQDHTPIEAFHLRGRTIYVKRDDLYGLPPAPPLAKLRGLRTLLPRLSQTPNQLVACFQTRVSNIGHGLAAACLDFPELRALVVYPLGKTQQIPETVNFASSLGATVHAIPANRLPINYAQAKRYAQAQGGLMLPFGMDCREAVDAIAMEAALVPDALLDGGTVIVSCGSGVTLAGLVRGFTTVPLRLIGISSGRV